jgi:hypothetical protein
MQILRISQFLSNLFFDWLNKVIEKMVLIIDGVKFSGIIEDEALYGFFSFNSSEITLNDLIKILSTRQKIALIHRLLNDIPIPDF